MKPDALAAPHRSPKAALAGGRPRPPAAPFGDGDVDDGGVDALATMSANEGVPAPSRGRARGPGVETPRPPASRPSRPATAATRANDSTRTGRVMTASSV